MLRSNFRKLSTADLPWLLPLVSSARLSTPELMLSANFHLPLKLLNTLPRLDTFFLRESKSLHCNWSEIKDRASISRRLFSYVKRSTDSVIRIEDEGQARRIPETTSRMTGAQ